LINLNRLFFLFAVIILSSCGGSKAVTETDINNTEVNKIILSHIQAGPSFNTLSARVQVVYEDEKKLQSITASLRMEKDKIIWIKASILGITLSKILITPDRVSYYESISNTYFEGDFTILSEVLGTEVDFNTMQTILLGQSIFSLDPLEYKAKRQMDTYKLIPKKQVQNFIYSILLNRKNFKVNTETLSQPTLDRLLVLRYGEYQEISGAFYPSEIHINTTEKDSKTKIDLNFKKIELNLSLSFPFAIPEGYEEIQF